LAIGALAFSIPHPRPIAILPHITFAQANLDPSMPIILECHDQIGTFIRPFSSNIAVSSPAQSARVSYSMVKSPVACRHPDHYTWMRVLESPSRQRSTAAGHCRYG
jgi:hypothetical protein